MQVFLQPFPVIVKSMKRVRWPSLILSVSICFFAAALGSFATSPSIPTWYAGLIKPPFNPPNWIFGPVWSILYLMMSVSFYLVKVTKAKKTNRIEATQFFISQLIFNTIWSIVFFGLHLPVIAFGVIVALWILILFTILRFYSIHKSAAYLLVPYILWVSFASVLNLTIALLNA